MAKLTRETFKSLGHRVCIYGPPKSGKSRLVAMLAEAGFTIDWFDLENGLQTLQQLSDEALERINYYKIPDTPLNPVGIVTLGKIFTARGEVTMCEEHAVITCPICMKNPNANFAKFDYTNLRDPNHVVVIDSVTQLTNSANARSGAKQLRELYIESANHKMEWDEWGYAGMLLTHIFGSLQQSNFNVVCISHEDMVEQTDSKKQIVPVAGTRNYSSSFGKYFDHVIYCYRENSSHKTASSTQFRANVLSGSRTNADTSLHTLADILRSEVVARKEVNPVATGTTTVKSAAGAGQGIAGKLLQRTKA